MIKLSGIYFLYKIYMPSNYSILIIVIFLFTKHSKHNSQMKVSPEESRG